MADIDRKKLQEALDARFSDAPVISSAVPDARLLLSMVQRGSCRDFRDRSIPEDVLDLLCATALASPTKSDLQQRDIIVLRSAKQRRDLADLVAGQAWVARAPLILIFCGNNRRQRLMHDWTGIPFANDHLDAFFNAVADAAIALGAFVTAAEALGLGCCPISAVRNEARKVSELLGLPQHTFPFAGLAVGFPGEGARISQRLPLKTTLHYDEYREAGLRSEVESYAERRGVEQPYASQRETEGFGEKQGYTWIDDKVRQYSRDERGDFGAFVKAQGFCLK